VITYLGTQPKVAMTVLYIAGVSISFFFNKNWTFKHKGSVSSTFVNYILVYACGYFLNLAGLYFFVDKLGFRHEWVQGVLIFLIALLLYAAQKSIVFKRETQ
jgi:putative flippase GtrA